MSEHDNKHQVRIHIDRRPYESPQVTTHAALYVLGKVPAGYELFLECRATKRRANAYRH